MSCRHTIGSPFGEYYDRDRNCSNRPEETKGIDNMIRIKDQIDSKQRREEMAIQYDLRNIENVITNGSAWKRFWRKIGERNEKSTNLEKEVGGLFKTLEEALEETMSKDPKMPPQSYKFISDHVELTVGIKIIPYNFNTWVYGMIINQRTGAVRTLTGIKRSFQFLDKYKIIVYNTNKGYIVISYYLGIEAKEGYMYIEDVMLLVMFLSSTVVLGYIIIKAIKEVDNNIKGYIQDNTVKSEIKKSSTSSFPCGYFNQESQTYVDIDTPEKQYWNDRMAKAWKRTQSKWNQSKL